MTKRLPCPPAPGPLEAYAQLLDGAFASLAQRRAFRAYLQGLLLPRERTKTLTALAGTEPVIGAHAPPAQRLQWFLSEGRWNPTALTTRRLAVLQTDRPTQPTDAGVLVLDETGDLKAGSHTAHVARQYLGSVGKIANGIVAVTSLWADADVYYPLHTLPYTPAMRLPGGTADPAFRTKPQLASALVDAALEQGIPFRAVVADCLYGENRGFEAALRQAQVPFVLGLKPSHGIRAPVEADHTPDDAARSLPWGGPRQPGGWTALIRRFRDGHRERWWAAELRLGTAYGPDRPVRLIAATTDPATLPVTSTWYVITNLPHAGDDRETADGLGPANLAEVVRLYGLRQWVEQSYRQVKGALGWADWQVRSDHAIRRHWELVCCAFAFCWWAWSRAPAAGSHPAGGLASYQPTTVAAVGRGKNVAGRGPERRSPNRQLAGSVAPGAGVAPAVDRPHPLVAGLVLGSATPGPAGAP